MEGAVAEHMVCDAGVVVATGVGFTVITATFGVPAHPAAVGVIVYVAVPAVVAVAVRIWAMVDPEAAVAPETSVCDTVQEKVVPVTVLVSAMEGAVPEQIV